MNEHENQSLNMTDPEENRKPVSTEPEKMNDTCESSTEEVCVEESSPSLDLAEEADKLMEEKGQNNTKDSDKTSQDDNSTNESKDTSEKGAPVNYHLMSKEELRDSLKAILDEGDMEKHKDVTYIKQSFYSLHNKQIAEEQQKFIDEGNPREAYAITPDPLEEEIKVLLTEFREKRNAYLEEVEEKKRKNLEEKNRIINELNTLSDDIDNINLHFSKFQQLQQEFKSIGEVPASSETEIWKNYQTAVEQFYDRLKLNKELRDLDFRKNLELKTLLIEKAKELTEISDPIEAFRGLQSLHQQWREIGPVAKELREDIWNQFKEATTVINKRHQDYFQNRKETEQANEEAKTLLCEKVESINLEDLKTFTDWDNATKEILNLQQEWKGLGFASRKVNNALFSRFREKCDAFFEAKAEFFKKSKEELKENLSKKEALCEKAEALLEKATEKNAFDEMQALQKEWRTIGMVRRKLGDEVWKRFCKAVDAFYDARKAQFSGKRNEENANLETKREIIAGLKNIPEDAEREEVIETIRELRNKWQETGFVPFKYKDEINQAYKEELDRIYKAFDIRENRRRMKRFENDIKKFEGDENKLNKEKEKLLRAIETRQNELNTIENNIGFFKMKSTAGNSMLKDFERKVEKLKEEIEQIQEKIKLLDSQDKEDQKEE